MTDFGYLVIDILRPINEIVNVFSEQKNVVKKETECQMEQKKLKSGRKYG